MKIREFADKVEIVRNSVENKVEDWNITFSKYSALTSAPNIE